MVEEASLEFRLRKIDESRNEEKRRRSITK